MPCLCPSGRPAPCGWGTSTSLPPEAGLPIPGCGREARQTPHEVWGSPPCMCRISAETLSFCIFPFGRAGGQGTVRGFSGGRSRWLSPHCCFPLPRVRRQQGNAAWHRAGRAAARDLMSCPLFSSRPALLLGLQIFKANAASCPVPPQVLAQEAAGVDLSSLGSSGDGLGGLCVFSLTKTPSMGLEKINQS